MYNHFDLSNINIILEMNFEVQNVHLSRNIIFSQQ